MSKHELALAKAIVVKKKGHGVEYTMVNKEKYDRNLWRTVWEHPIAVMTLGSSYRSVGNVGGSYYYDEEGFETPYLRVKERFRVIMCQPIRSAHGGRYTEPFAVLPEDLDFNENE